MNVVMTGSGKFIEVQGTAEGAPFSEETLQQMLAIGKSGIRQLTSLQCEALGVAWPATIRAS